MAMQLNLEKFISHLPSFPYALCVTISDKDYFFPESKRELKERIETLQGLCAQCPHKKQCLKFAVDNHITEGIWGGTTPIQRQKLITKKKGENLRHREIQKLFALGLNRLEVAQKLDIKPASLDRAIARMWQREESNESKSLANTHHRNHHGSSGGNPEQWFFQSPPGDDESH